MRGYMFRNRWFALLFVGLTLAGVTTLVGTDQDHGTLQEAAGQIAAQRAQADKLTTQTPSDPATVEAAETVFASDEELIDTAAGEDPTPPDDFAAANADPEAAIEDITIVSREVAGAPADAPPPVLETQ